MNKLFVYGTLMRGNSNHDFMKGCRFICKGTIEGYTLFDLGSYPGIRPAEGKKVRGEFYLVPDQAFEKIKMLEGDGYLYVQQEVEVKLDKYPPTEAITFVYNYECEGHYREDTSGRLWRFQS